MIIIDGFQDLATETMCQLYDVYIDPEKILELTDEAVDLIIKASIIQSQPKQVKKRKTSYVAMYESPLETAFRLSSGRSVEHYIAESVAEYYGVQNDSSLRWEYAGETDIDIELYHASAHGNTRARNDIKTKFLSNPPTILKFGDVVVKRNCVRDRIYRYHVVRAAGLGKLSESDFTRYVDGEEITIISSEDAVQRITVKK